MNDEGSYGFVKAQCSTIGSSYSDDITRFPESAIKCYAKKSSTKRINLIDFYLDAYYWCDLGSCLLGT